MPARLSIRARVRIVPPAERFFQAHFGRCAEPRPGSAVRLCTNVRSQRPAIEYRPPIPVPCPRAPAGGDGHVSELRGQASPLVPFAQIHPPRLRQERHAHVPGKRGRFPHDFFPTPCARRAARPNHKGRSAPFAKAWSSFSRNHFTSPRSRCSPMVSSKTGKETRTRPPPRMPRGRGEDSRTVAST